MAENGTGAGPRDAAVMEAILREMGVEDFEPNVIHQMLEFTYSQSFTSADVFVYMYMYSSHRASFPRYNLLYVPGTYTIKCIYRRINC